MQATGYAGGLDPGKRENPGASAAPGFSSFLAGRSGSCVFLHEQRGKQRNQSDDRCALDGGDGVGHVLGDGIHCFFLQMNYYLVWLDISTDHP